ncbi:MAG: FG-GAP repeat protein [Xanthomonadales bacterium]|nr:FG-GAP repeat protein [Xanthomonadales bacterium]
MKNNVRYSLNLILGISFLFSIANAYAQISTTELDRIFASDAAQGDGYGYAVDVDGDRAVIGSRLDDDGGNGSGAAYVYLKNSLTSLWQEEKKLVMASAAAGDNFGSSVAIDRNVIVVGAPQDDINVGSNLHGSAHVFTRGPNGWDDGVELLPQDTDTSYQNYGVSVDIDNDTIVVGVAYDNDEGTASGSAYVFELVSGTWQKTAKLLPPNAGTNQNFGWSVAIDNDTIVIGAPHWTASGAGSAYVFTRAGGWTDSSTTLPATDVLADDQFGWSVAISSDIAVVGARMDDDVDNGTDSGSISIFDRSSGSWDFKAKKTASNGAQSDWFGSDVATNGQAVVAGAQQSGNGARGSIYSFSHTGSEWVEDGELWPPTNPGNVSFIQQFGASLALDGTTLFVGAPASDIYNGSSFVYITGAAFVYGLNATAIPAFNGGGLLTIQSPPGTFLTNVTAIDPATLGTLPQGISSPLGVSFPQEVSFPLGALGFNVNGLTPGAAIEVEIEFPEEVSASSYYKFSDQWYEFLDDGTTGATVTPGKVTLKFVDGGRGDHDETADGVIVDPGALSVITIGETVFEDGFED